MSVQLICDACDKPINNEDSVELFLRRRRGSKQRVDFHYECWNRIRGLCGEHTKEGEA